MDDADQLPVDPDTARRTARDILARPEYQPRADSLLRRFLRWLGDLLRRLDPAPPQPGPTGSPQRLSPVAVIVLAVLLALALYLLYRLVRTVWRDGLPRRRRRTDDDEVEVEADAEAPTTGADEADRLEAEGRWREAVIARYRATVARLALAGWLAPRSGSSSGELRSELRDTLPDAAPPFDGLTGAFEDAHYGGREPDRSRVDTTRADAAGVVAVLDERRRAGVAPPALRTEDDDELELLRDDAGRGGADHGRGDDEAAGGDVVQVEERRR